LHHGERHFGLNADDDGFRAAQPDHVRQFMQGARSKRIDHIEGSDIDDHPTRAVVGHLLDQRIAQADQIQIA
jgi:hypothetical protein